MIEYLTIIQSDNVEAMKTLPDASVELCVTSPPYDNLRTYGKEDCEWDFPSVAREIFRILVPGGVCCWNVGDAIINGGETLTSMRQAIHFVDVAGFLMHDTMIWNKLNFANPETARYHQLFEYVFILSKGKPRTFNPIKDKPNATAGRIGALGKNTFTKRDGAKSTRTTYVTENLGMRGNVWKGKTRGQEEFCRKGSKHPAMMPKWLARDLILSWSNPCDTVIDCFGGSGTTGQEALKIGRKAILIDDKPEYIKEMRQNCKVTLGLALV